MRVGLVSVAYHEPRFIGPHVKHIPGWVDEKLVLVSEKPWQGQPESRADHTAALAEAAGAYTIIYNWATEQEQRNAGQDWFFDMDWIIVLDPDEFLTHDDWDNLKEFLENADGDAYVTGDQLTYWKSGFVISPHEEYRQILAVKPSVRFVDKRVVNCSWGYVPTVLHHFSWARTDAEVMRKLSHYSHAHEINIERWYRTVWEKWTPEMKNLHPLTPPALAKAIPTKLPEELERLNLWPTKPIKATPIR